MRNRADIDGLRAVAVAMVMAFHAGVPGLKGGFAGVDVFFVVSGFLIGGLVAGRQAAGTFSLTGFWERRVRRILPALLVVLAVCSVLAWFLLLPSDLTAFARSGVAALLSVANLWFWRHTGYFLGVGADQPLLHTWSLGVEEQFYLAFPLFMLAGARWFPGRLRTVLAGGGLASFALAAWAAEASPDAAFYLPVTRAWELLLGVWLALRPPAPPPGWLTRWGGLAGVAMILASAVLYDESTRFPGLPALLPCLGAALVIAAQGGGVAGRLLSLRPVVGLGLISYSLYLWHWPLLTFQKLTSPGGQAVWPVVAVVALSVVLAVLTWKFIEQPFRDARRVSGRALIGWTAAGVAVLLAAAGATLAAKGFPQRFDDRALAYGGELQRPHGAGYRIGPCFVSGGPVENYRRDQCLTPDPARPDWLLVGDSHAAHLWQGLQAANPDINLMQANVTGCRLLPRDRTLDHEPCRVLSRLVYDDALPRLRPDGVILAARWREGDLPAIGEAVDAARRLGLPVVLVGPAVQYDDALPRILALSAKLDDPDLPARRRLVGPERLDREMAAWAKARGVRYVSLFDALCDEDRCITEAPGLVPLSHDYSHLTAEGSRLVGERLKARGDFPPR